MDTLWVLLSPDPHPARAVCLLRILGTRFETVVEGLGATLRWGYHSREAAVGGAMRLCAQLLQRGWIRCEASGVETAMAGDLVGAKRH